MNAIEGLLILGQYKMYIIDNYFNRSDQEICDVWDETVKSQRDPILQVLAGQESTAETSREHLERGHACRSFAYESITSASKRQFLFRDVALELFFSDGRNHLITLLNNERDTVHRKITARANLGDRATEQSRKDTVSSFGSFGSKFLSVFSISPAAQAATRWENREISNFEYLMTINSLAGRSYNDLTQYPIMPWILADYTSQVLDLQNPATYRDLGKNMGAQTSERRKDFQERYNSFAAAGIEETKPFHFGTHYSSAMIVCSFLIRLVPFVESYLLLQGGHFDHPDRLFYSIHKAWLSASKENMTDVREITPEWFYLPEFLLNSNKFDFGTTQVGGHRVGDVLLPPWAHNSPEIFIKKHREALESEYVSQRLHLWIDLIFGYKQLGSAAVEATNIFHALSYHGAIDLDTVKDPVERLATIGIIHNFGQTPRQVFTKPHIQRGPRNQKDMLDSQIAKLELLPGHVDHNGPIMSITVLDGIHAVIFGRVPLASFPGLHVQWLTTDQSIRIVSHENRLVGHFPSLHTDRITQCRSVGTSLVLASDDTTLSILKISSSKESSLMLSQQSHLRGHKAPISSMAVSGPFSTIVSGDIEGTVLIFDLNRAEYVRTLHRGLSKVCSTTISDVTGNIIISTDTEMKVYTVNGCLLAEAMFHDLWGETSACAFYTENVIFTGHVSGTSLAWKLGLKPVLPDPDNAACWQLVPIKLMTLPNGGEKITTFTTKSTRLYIGTSKGRIYTWATT